MKQHRQLPVPHRIYRPLIPVTLALAAGIAVGAWQPGLWLWSLGGIAAGVVIWGLQFFRSREALLSPVFLCALVGYLSIQPWLGSEPCPQHVAHFADQGYWAIRGKVAAAAVVHRGRWQFLLEAGLLENKHRRVAVHGLVRVTGRGEWPGAGVGDRVIFRGRLRSIRSFVNPGGFDYERYMRFNGVLTRVYASAKSFRIESSATSKGIVDRIQSLGHALSLEMEKALGDAEPEPAALLKALILGQRDQISAEFREKFNRSGVGHILAISGLHVGMVAAVAFAAATWIMPLVPKAVERAWCRRGAALFSLGPVLVYGVLAGLSPSTQRAMLMVSVFLAGFWVGRRHDWLNSLALAALVILVWHPPALLTISFQLSFAAVLAIVAGSRRWPERMEGPPRGRYGKISRRGLAFIRISAFAIVGTLPLVLHYFNQISTVGLAANLMVVPLVGLVVVPAGLAGALTCTLNPDTGHFFWQIAAWGADLICWTVRTVAAWPWASLQSVTPSAVEITLFYLLCFMGMYWRKLPYRTAIVVCVLVFCLLDVGYWLRQRYGADDLRVTALDVGQASANLLELPGGYTILVDGGGFSDNSVFDVGARVLAPILWCKKIRTVDLVVLSHANSDHLNGLLYIIDHFKVPEVWSNGEPAQTKGYRRWTRLLALRGVRHAAFDLLPRQKRINGVQLEILSPPRGFLQRTPGDGDRDLNNNSLVLRVALGEISFLFSGDIMAPGESRLLARSGAHGLHSTVLMIPHHGSRSSSTRDFLRAVAPEEAIISAGWQNRFGFPHEHVIRRLRTEGCRIWCTADAGAVKVVTNGKSYTISSFRQQPP